MRILFLVSVLAVMLVNGVTDAPNAIATAVTTRSLRPTFAIIIATLCNFLGAALTSFFMPSVAETVFNAVELGDDVQIRISALCAAMCAVVFWSMLAFLFGLPTSESHALIFGIAGAAIASKMSLDAINFGELLLVGIGLVASTVPTFFLAKQAYRVCLSLCSGIDRRRAMKHFSRAQAIGAAWSAFMHGAQDSQKFLGVLMLGVVSAEQGTIAFKPPVRLVLLTSSVMAFGTLIGGKRIIKKIGVSMTRLDAAGGTCSDTVSSFVMSLCSILGLPVSTTHAKTTAMMGVGCERGRFNRSVAREIILAWILTFPCCIVIGFLLGLIFLR